MISGIIPDVRWNQRVESDLPARKEATSPAEAELEHYKDGVRRQREGNVYNSIYHKMMGGQQLSIGEETTLRERDLKVYMEYKADKKEQKVYEERLRHCKSKEEAQRMHLNKVHSNLSALRKIINDPCISKQKKVKEVQRIQGATTSTIRSFHEFVEGGDYQNLMAEQEIQQLESVMSRNAGNVKEDFALHGYREEEMDLSALYKKENGIMNEIRKIHSEQAGTEKGLEVDVLV